MVVSTSMQQTRDLYRFGILFHAKVTRQKTECNW